MKIAVTGASGHIGAALVRELMTRGHAVRALVHRNMRGLEALPVEKVEGDLRAGDSLRRAFAGAEIVIHAAGRISVARTGIRRLLETNLGGTENVIAACRAAGVRRLVHFSSVEALSSAPKLGM